MQLLVELAGTFTGATVVASHTLAKQLLSCFIRCDGFILEWSAGDSQQQQ
jgi:hypothetical protein